MDEIYANVERYGRLIDYIEREVAEMRLIPTPEVADLLYVYQLAGRDRDNPAEVVEAYTHRGGGR